MVGGSEIRAKREAQGWSQARLAEAASQHARVKIAQQVIARVEEGRDSKHKLAVLQVLGLLPLLEATRVSEPSVELAPDAPSAASQVGRVRDVPELGIAVGGSDGDFSLNGETIGYVPRPLSLFRRDVFAVRVRSDSMYPRFREGALLYVERHREPAVGDDGVFEMHPGEEGQAGHAFVKELVSKNIQTVVVRQFNPPGEITYERRRMKAMYRVLPTNELLGV